MDGIPGDFLSKVTVGRCVNDTADCSRHGGMFSDFNIWSRPLTKQEMLDWTSCRDLKGDIVNWNTAQWSALNMAEELEELSNLCQQDSIKHVLIPGDWSMAESIKICNQLGGQLAMVTSEANQYQLLQTYLSNPLCSSKCKSMTIFLSPFYATNCPQY